MIKNRKASAMMLTVFISILLVSTMLLTMSNTIETSIRYTKSNSSAISWIIEDRNKNERIYTEIYKIVNAGDDKKEIVNNLKDFSSLGIKYEAGPITIDNNKIEFIFVDSNYKNYRFIIEENNDNNQVDLHRIY